jgi:hypothetical protein
VQTQVWGKNYATFTTYSVVAGTPIPERIKHFGIGQAIEAGWISTLAALIWLAVGGLVLEAIPKPA